MDEPWDWPSTGSNPPLAKQATPNEPAEKSAKPKTDGPLFIAKPNRRVVTLGGYWGAWRVITSTAVSGPQHFFASKEWPKDWVSENQKSGFAISSLAGDVGGWAAGR